METFRSKLYFDSVLVGHADTSGLTAGSTKTYYWDMTWPSDNNPHTIKVITDADGAISESNEGNNERSESFSDVCPTPGTPSNPSPSNHATDVSINTDLDWSDCSNTDFYDVYFGTSSPPPY